MGEKARRIAEGTQEGAGAVSGVEGRIGHHSAKENLSGAFLGPKQKTEGVKMGKADLVKAVKAATACRVLAR